MASLKQLVVDAYIHRMQREYKFNIPSDIIIIILMFIPTKYKVYSTGTGGGKEQDIGSKRMRNTIFYYLPQVSALCAHPSLLYAHWSHTLIHGCDNAIFGCGSNNYGELGLGKKLSFKTFTRLQFEDIDQDCIVTVLNKGVCSSHNFVVFRNPNNNKQSFYGFGNNKSNILGVASNDEIRTPIILKQLNHIFSNQKIVEISTGFEHTLFLSSSGRVHAYGSNKCGQCGVDPVVLGKIHSPNIVPFLYDIVSVSSGEDHNLCIDHKKALWVFGDNGRDQLGLGTDHKADDFIHSAMINPYFKGMLHVACIIAYV